MRHRQRRASRRGVIGGDIGAGWWQGGQGGLTKPVVAMLVSLSPGEGVGACGSPVKTGLAKGAAPRLAGLARRSGIRAAIADGNRAVEGKRHRP